MRPIARKRLILAATASSSLLGILAYPAIKSVFPIKKQAVIIDDYVNLPTGTADLTKDIAPTEVISLGADTTLGESHWLLLSKLRSKRLERRERALDELGRQRRWNDAECIEIAQALRKKDIIRLARTPEADLRLFLPPPSLDFIQKTLQSNDIEKLVRAILKDVSEQAEMCSNCTHFYTNLSLRVRPDSNLLAMSDLNQVDKVLKTDSRKPKMSTYKKDVVRLKAVLNNVICGEEQALSMTKSGLLLAMLYFRHKYKNDVQISALLAQILANLSVNTSTRDFIFSDGWVRTLVEYARDERPEVSLPALKALSNLDDEESKSNGIYHNHIYLLAPSYHQQLEPEFDVVFIHGLVGSIFKSWRQGPEPSKGQSLPTELLPAEILVEETENGDQSTSVSRSRCWPKDWLARDLPNIRILAIDYPTALSSWRTDCDLNKDTLKERANLVMQQLEDAKLGQRPIVWVAHSMGGLLVKQILVSCQESLDRPSSSKSQSVFRENLLKQTKGIAFYSVPHRGSNLDWIERKNLQKLLMLTTEVIELQKGSSVLEELHKKFLNLTKLRSDIKFVTFYEKCISSFGINKVIQWRGILVHEDSLQFEVGSNYKLNIDHSNTCKPYSKSAITYTKTLELIRSLMPKPAESEYEKMMPYISFVF